MHVPRRPPEHGAKPIFRSRLRSAKVVQQQRELWRHCDRETQPQLRAAILPMPPAGNRAHSIEVGMCASQIPARNQSQLVIEIARAKPLRWIPGRKFDSVAESQCWEPESLIVKAIERTERLVGDSLERTRRSPRLRDVPRQSPTHIHT